VVVGGASVTVASGVVTVRVTGGADASKMGVAVTPPQAVSSRVMKSKMCRNRFIRDVLLNVRTLSYPKSSRLKTGSHPFFKKKTHKRAWGKTRKNAGWGIHKWSLI
jgi:hypothetical protein